MKRNRNRRFKIAVFLAIMIFLSSGLSGCAKEEQESKMALSGPVKIAALNGPTGIGMVQLMEQPEKYKVEIYQSPDEVVGKVINSEVDLASVPSNMAAVLYQKTEGEIVAISPNTLGVLCLVENGSTVQELTDLKGKTIIASGRGGAPEYILNRLLLNAGLDPATDVTMQWLANHTDVASNLMAKEGTVALLPEPFVSVVLGKSTSIHLAADFNEAWKNSYKMELPMGVLIARKAFVEEREADLRILMEDYKTSVNFVNTQTEDAAVLISRYGLIADEKTAGEAIPKCNIVISDNTSENQEMLSHFYEILYGMEPKSIGGKIPDEAFYFQWTEE